MQGDPHWHGENARKQGAEIVEDSEPELKVNDKPEPKVVSLQEEVSPRPTEVVE